MVSSGLQKAKKTKQNKTKLVIMRLKDGFVVHVLGIPAWCQEELQKLKCAQGLN